MDYRQVYNINEDFNVLCVCSIGKYTLKIIYDVNKPHLSSDFTKYDKETLRDYILNHTEEAFWSALDIIDERCYLLNISSSLHFYGPAGMEVYRNMLNIYMPIIQKFMEDALTDNLYVIEDGKLKKQ